MCRYQLFPMKADGTPRLGQQHILFCPHFAPAASSHEAVASLAPLLASSGYAACTCVYTSVSVSQCDPACCDPTFMKGVDANGHSCYARQMVRPWTKMRQASHHTHPGHYHGCCVHHVNWWRREDGLQFTTTFASSRNGTIRQHYVRPAHNVRAPAMTTA